MGNRAVITTDIKLNKPGIYLHWNGGRDSVEGFLTYCKMRGFRTPENDSYGMARLTQIIANFIGGSLSIGVNTAKNLDCDNYDNGVYIISDWEIVNRLHFKRSEQQSYKLKEMLYAIDEKQPEEDRLGKDKIREWLKNNPKEDKPEAGKLYSLTGKGKSIANGNSWADSEVSA